MLNLQQVREVFEFVVVVSLKGLSVQHRNNYLALTKDVVEYEEQHQSKTHQQQPDKGQVDTKWGGTAPSGLEVLLHGAR